jgi:hypothetical protein
MNGGLFCRVAVLFRVVPDFTSVLVAVHPELAAVNSTHHSSQHNPFSIFFFLSSFLLCLCIASYIHITGLTLARFAGIQVYT